MPICIYCTHPVPPPPPQAQPIGSTTTSAISSTTQTTVSPLYTTYARADDKSLGRGVRLTQCANCKRFADKYVEHDYVVLFIDLVLCKREVLRSLLFNRLGQVHRPETLGEVVSSGVHGSSRSRERGWGWVTRLRRWRVRGDIDPSVLRLAVLLVLFDVYIMWAEIEQNQGQDQGIKGSNERASVLFTWPILNQYLFFLALNLLATVAQHASVRVLAGAWQRYISRFRDDTTITINNNNNGLIGTSDYLDKTNDNEAENAAEQNSNTTSSNLQSHSRNASRSPAPSARSSPFKQAPARPDSRANPKPTPYKSASTQPSSPSNPSTIAKQRPPSSSISTALLISSCTKLFPILLVIWPTDKHSQTFSSDATTVTTGNAISTRTGTSTTTTVTGVASNTTASFAPRLSSYISWVVLFNNVEALNVLLDCGYIVSIGLAVAGMAARHVIELLMLRAVGLNGSSGGSASGGLIEIFKGVRGVFGG